MSPYVLVVAPSVLSPKQLGTGLTCTHIFYTQAHLLPVLIFRIASGLTLNSWDISLSLYPPEIILKVIVKMFSIL